jgi:hypothetical protein
MLYAREQICVFANFSLHSDYFLKLLVRIDGGDHRALSFFSLSVSYLEDADIHNFRLPMVSYFPVTYQ